MADDAYDAVASVEMGEHVGRANYPAYAATLARLVRERGRVLVQQMSRDHAPGGGAFIGTYIAPDMAMTPVGTTTNELEAAGLAGGALAFEQNRMGVNQILAVRTAAGGGSGMPATRTCG